MQSMLTQGGQISTIRLDSPIAQLVEQRTVNPCVPGSSPGWGAIFKWPDSLIVGLAFLWVKLKQTILPEIIPIPVYTLVNYLFDY